MKANNLIVFKITPAGVEVFALNPAVIDVVVIDETKPSIVNHIVSWDGKTLGYAGCDRAGNVKVEEGDSPVEYNTMAQAAYKARKLGMVGYSIKPIKKQRAEIELAQVLTRLPADDLENVRKLYKEE